MAKTSTKNLTSQTPQDRFRTQYNYSSLGTLFGDYEKPNPSSDTVPDGSIGINELFIRYQRGLAPNIYLEGDDGREDCDFSDERSTDLLGFDLTDANDLAHNVKSAQDRYYSSRSTLPLSGDSSLSNESSPASPDKGPAEPASSE